MFNIFNTTDFGLGKIAAKISKLPKQALDFCIEFGVAAVDYDHIDASFKDFMYEFPLTPSSETKEINIAAVQAAQESGSSDKPVQIITSVAHEEKLDAVRDAHAAFVCSYIVLKRYTIKAYKTCVYLLGL